MKVRVKFLATFRTLFGGRERELEVASNATVGDVLNLLGDTPERRKELFAGDAWRPHVVVLRNGSPAAPGAPLSPGDTVAVFPFLTGG